MNPGLLDFRRHLPRWSAANKPHNTALVETIATIAQRHAATPAQIALAWLLHQGKDVIPIPGTSRPDRIDENLGAFCLTLTPDDLHTLNNLTPRRSEPPRGYAAVGHPLGPRCCHPRQLRMLGEGPAVVTRVGRVEAAGAV